MRSMPLKSGKPWRRVKSHHDIRREGSIVGRSIMLVCGHRITESNVGGRVMWRGCKACRDEVKA